VAAARQKLALAQTHLARAKGLLQAKQYDLALMTAELALVVSADAIVVRDGFICSDHASRLAYPSLPPLFSANAALARQIRTSRNAAQYDAAGGTSQAFATQATALAEQAVNAVMLLIP